MVDRLNDFMRNMWRIDWCGQFSELCEGTGEFPTKIRGSFSEDNELTKASVISQEMIGDFVTGEDVGETKGKISQSRKLVLITSCGRNIS